ncbi:hypothetical protein F2Q69_00036181 [Brassica cretica]|uniref:Uncharacterized protein n=1 Tax=Brassica cretica TaxID=69181 RepID=A0A8S9SHW2_BRACR|nr:hypothetical protein F2Q69_00036181 [Brassica cretica]
MHLSCPRKSEIGTGKQGISQEGHKNRAELSQEDGHTSQGKKLQERQPSNQTCQKKNIILHHAEATKNVENFSGCKEASFKDIPPDYLMLSSFEVKTLSRALKPVAEPEVDPIPYSTSQSANQDIRALQIPYLTNQEGLNHEANCYGFHTQEEVQANWSRAKIFTETEVINFTSQRFLSPSICEYPTLEGDSSSSKEWPEAKPIIGINRGLSDF